MGGDLLEVLFVVAFILFGLLGGRKKRPQQGTPPARPRPQGRAPLARRTPPGPQPTTARAPAREQDRLLRELEGLLTGRRPVRSEPEPARMPSSTLDVPDPDEARSLESIDIDEAGGWDEGLERTSETAGTARWSAGSARAAESLETLEAAGGASHKRFHALYDRPPEPVKQKPVPPAFPGTDVRRAMVWSEILAPPVSLRDDRQ
jgi:hypothetical protein